MLRLRRYRVFVVFTIIFILTVFHFARSREWSPAAEPAPPVDLTDSKPPASDRKQDPPSFQHGFIPEDLEVKPFKPEEKQPGTDVIVDVEEPIPSSIVKTPSTEPISDPVAPDPAKEYGAGLPGYPPDTSASDFGPQGQGRLEVILPDAGRPVPHWQKLPEHFPVPPEQLIKLPTGQPKRIPKLQFDFKKESSEEQLQRQQRLDTIKEAFEHAWKGYKSAAMGHDEVIPVEGGYRDPFSGWGATLVDTLDTLWIMGLEEEFSAAVEEVKKIDFTTSPRKDIPLFETAIRYLGGLIGAYDVSGQKYSVLLDKAVELAEILIGAFDTPNRMPITYYNWAPDYVSQPHRANTRVVLAELGSLSMEFTRLAQLKKEDKYYDAIARVTNELEKMQNSTGLPGMWPLQIDASGCKKVHRDTPQMPTVGKSKDGHVPNVPSPHMPQRAPTDVDSYKNYISPSHRKRDGDDGVQEDAQPADYNEMPEQTPAPKSLVSGLGSDASCEEQGLASPPYSTSDRFGLGGQSDSTYEYLPKEYMLLGGLNDQYRTMYEKSMDTVRKYLLFRPMLKDDRDIRFAATVTSTRPPTDKEDTNALKYQYEGTHLTCFAGGMFAVGAKIFGINSDMDIASKLTDGCVWAYESTTTGIMPEIFEVLPCENMDSCPWNETRYNDVLDPYPEWRFKQAQTLYEQQLKLAKQAQEELKKLQRSEESEPEPAPQEADPSPLAQLPAHGSESRISPRDVDPAENQHEESPTKTVKEDEDSAGVPGTEITMPMKPSVLSHKDFVKALIEEERITPGFSKISSRKYILRPEAIESVFIMFRLTGDDYWREKGWKMYGAIARHTRTELANSAINDVTSGAPQFLDSMESFWLAETLKYFYLLFSDPSVVSLDEYVLNTEAHPFKRPT